MANKRLSEHAARLAELETWAAEQEAGNDAA